MTGGNIFAFEGLNSVLFERGIFELCNSKESAGFGAGVCESRGVNFTIKFLL